MVLAESRGVVVKNMNAWANDVKSGDSDNLEARAAAYYWKNLFPKISGFVRGREESPPNNLLNYGYAILRAIVARALVASGMLPTFGIHLHNHVSFCTGQIKACICYINFVCAQIKKTMCLQLKINMTMIKRK